MKALYSESMKCYFKLAPDDFVFTDKELELLATGEWSQATIQENFDGNLSHYFKNEYDGTMSLLPESDWPENQEESI